MIPQKTCALAEHWIVMDYKDGGDESRAGTFVHASAASWNGVLLVTKTYQDGKCLISYRTSCEGTSVYLDLDDTCGWRTTRRRFFTSTRQTKLHKGSYLFRSADTAITVLLAGGSELELQEAGAEVTFTLVDSNEETGKVTGAADFRYFINSPRLDVCIPSDAAVSDFVSRGTGLGYSTQKCSACRLFLAGALRSISAESKALPGLNTAVTACWHGATLRGRTECASFGGQLKSNHSSICDMVSGSWAGRGEGMDAELASSMACQDVGCCPLDGDLATQFDEIIAEREGREHDLEAVTNLSVATKVLEDPATRHMLELMITDKVFNSQNGDEPRDHLERLPTKDSECQWDYAAAQCAHQGVCSYQYKFLDLTFDESCRLRVRSSRPLTNSDCLWDPFGATCADPEFCKRRCKFGNSLNQCCKLRDVPASTDTMEDEAPAEEEPDDRSPPDDELEPEGNCDNPTDRDILAGPNLPDDLEKIGRQCFSVFKFQIGAAKSLKMHEALGLSSPCAVCFVDTSVCGINKCFKLLSTKGKQHPDSQACLEENCNSAIQACSGLPPSDRSR